MVTLRALKFKRTFTGRVKGACKGVSNQIRFVGRGTWHLPLIATGNLKNKAEFVARF
jgi:hypothetical protein